MAKRLTKYQLQNVYGITEVAYFFPYFSVKKGSKELAITKDGKIAVTDYSKPGKPFRTQIPVLRITYAWLYGSIEANEIAVYDHDQNKIVAMSCSDFRRNVLKEWAKKQVKGGKC